MDTNLNVATAPKDSTFQVRINSEIKRTVENIYAETDMIKQSSRRIHILNGGFNGCFGIDKFLFLEIGVYVAGQV